MSQSFAQIYLHLVFATKGRRPFLQNQALLVELHRYLGGMCNHMNCPVVCVGGVADHVHVVCSLGRSVDVAELVKELKRESSKWIKSRDVSLADFQWQSGYGAFSVSPGRHVEALNAYVAGQEAHHKTEAYQDEFRRLLTKYGLTWDDRYVWD
jgi:REP element-mobilizing transposase RayT